MYNRGQLGDYYTSSTYLVSLGAIHTHFFLRAVGEITTILCGTCGVGVTLGLRETHVAL